MEPERIRPPALLARLAAALLGAAALAAIAPTAAAEPGPAAPGSTAPGPAASGPTSRALPAAPFPGAHPYGEGVLGAVRTHRVAPGESLIEIARAHDLGYREIVDANPALDPFVPGTGAAVTVPTAWILPSAAAPGKLVVNLSEMRLYYVLAGGDAPTVVTFPVGIGTEGTGTPVGSFRVVEKVANPSWYPPDSIREEDPGLPPVVPPGPDNPLGTHALRLSARSILIHGTDRPWGIGRRASHGCIRLYPEDIVRLFELVRVGTPVEIVREPVKAAADAGRAWIEVQADADLAFDYAEEAWRALARKGFLGPVDRPRLERAVRERSGIPVEVSP